MSPPLVDLLRGSSPNNVTNVKISMPKQLGTHIDKYLNKTYLLLSLASRTRRIREKTCEALLKLGESTVELKKACGNSAVLIGLSNRAIGMKEENTLRPWHCERSKVWDIYKNISVLRSKTKR